MWNSFVECNVNKINRRSSIGEGEAAFGVRSDARVNLCLLILVGYRIVIVRLVFIFRGLGCLGSSV